MEGGAIILTILSLVLVLQVIIFEQPIIMILLAVENYIYMVHISVVSLEVPCNHRPLALSCFFKPGIIYITSSSSYFWVVILLAGIALEALAGVVSLASSEMDQSMVSWILCWYHLLRKAFKKDVSSVALKSGIMLLHSVPCRSDANVI